MISALAAAGLLVGAAGATAAAGDIGGGDVDSSSAPSSTAAAPADPGTGASTDGTTDSVAPPVHVPHLDGDVSAVNTGSILITDHEGFTRTINVSDATTYGDGIALPIEVGEHIHAEGSVAADGTSLDATAISLAPEPPAPGTGGPGAGGPPAPPADGSAPALPEPPADGSAPTPPTDGSAPTPPAVGATASGAPTG